MSGVDPALLAVFRAEAHEVVGGLVKDLENIPGANGEERVALLRSVQRALHNLKGGARLAGVFDAEMLAHLLEEELGRAGTNAPPELLRRVRRGVWLALAILEDKPEAPDELAAFLTETGSSAEGEGSEEASPSSAPAGNEAGPPGMPGAPATPRAPSAPTAATAGHADSSFVRVQTSRLDRVMRLAGELPVEVVRRHDLVQRLDAVVVDMDRLRRGLDPAARAVVESWVRALEPLVDEGRRLAGARVAEDLGDALKRLRMQRLEEERTAWHRIVEETADALGRRVRFVCDVGDVELDREVQEALRDPLLHLLRNAVDHGIEDAGPRAAAGKPEVGLVRVSAMARGMTVVLHVEDDGRGIDLAAIRARAVERGLMSAADAAVAHPEQLAELVFEPGFSTASSVSRISGRGVGMDVVRARARGLGGHVVIEDRAPGTRVILTLPATVVSTRALLVRAGSAVGGLPLQYVQRVRRAPVSEIVAVDGGAALPRPEGRPLRLRWLAPLLGVDRALDADDVIVIEAGIEGAEVGIVVDETLGEQQLVSRPLPWNLGVVPGISGAAILADGRVAPLLDVDQIVSSSRGARAPEVVRASAAPVRQRVLVVDDSLTSRTLQRNILTSAGYDVELAVDGEDGWSKLEQSRPALVLSDVEMPRLTGLELVKRIRRSERWKTLPVILVTSLERPEEIAAGSAAGADEYIVKGRFDQRALLEAVARLCGGGA